MSDDESPLNKTLLVGRLIAFTVLTVGIFIGPGFGPNYLYTIGTISLGALIGYETYQTWDTLSPKERSLQCFLVFILVFLGVF